MGRAAITVTKDTFDDPKIFLAEVKFKQIDIAEIAELVKNTVKTYGEVTAILRIDERIGYYPIIVMESTRIIGANFLIESMCDLNEDSLVFNAKEVYQLFKRNKQI